MMPLTDIGWLVLLCAIVFFALGLAAARWGKQFLRSVRWTFVGRQRFVHRGTWADFCQPTPSDNTQEDA